MKILRLFVALLVPLSAIALAVRAGESLVSLAANPAAPAAPTPAPWPMFHRDERHTGAITAEHGGINDAVGPVVRWKFQVTDPPSEEDLSVYRWYASFPLGDVDGDGTLEVVVTTPDRVVNNTFRDRIIVLKDVPHESPPVRVKWAFTSSLTYTDTPRGFDQYSAALVDADNDGLPDIVFTSKEGIVRALKGTNGDVLWAYDTDHFIEAGPMIADLDGNGTQEVIVTTDCAPGPECVPLGGQGGSLFVFAAHSPSPSGTLIYSLPHPYKMDSMEAAVADLDPTDGLPLKSLVIGTWGGELLVVWRHDGGQVVTNAFNLRTLDSGVPHDAPDTVMRSSPLLADFGEGLTAVFGWMPTWQVGAFNQNSQARVSAVRLSAHTFSNTVDFEPRWTITRAAWKSSATWLPAGEPKVVIGYGLGTISTTGSYGLCDETRFGGIVAMTATGGIAWEHNWTLNGEGNVRGSPAVADIDGDGRLDVLLAAGCFGKLHAYDGETGAAKWSFQLGPRTIASPALGDLDGDGALEIVIPSYDGNVWALGAGPKTYLPVLRR